jgi:hypothetical protein
MHAISVTAPLLLATPIAAAVIFWLWSTKKDDVPARGVWVIFTTIVWAIVAIRSELVPVNFGHDVAAIADFIGYIFVRGSILAGVCATSVVFLWRSPVARALQWLTFVSAAPRILVWWTPRGVSDAVGDAASFVSLVGSFALIGVACYALFRTMMPLHEAPPPDSSLREEDAVATPSAPPGPPVRVAAAKPVPPDRQDATQELPTPYKAGVRTQDVIHAPPAPPAAPVWISAPEYAVTVESRPDRRAWFGRRGVIFLAAVVVVVLLLRAFMSITVVSEPDSIWTHNAKESAEFCRALSVTKWRIVPGGIDPEDLLLEVTVNPGKTGELGIGMVGVQGERFAFGTNRVISAPNSPYYRNVIPVKKNQPVTLTRVIEPYKGTSELPVLAYFQLCTHQTKANVCEWVYFGDKRRWPNSGQGCRLPPPSEAPDGLYSSPN